MVRKHGDVLQELVQQHATLVLSRLDPESLDVEIGERCRHRFEAACDVVELFDLGLQCIRHVPCRFDALCESCLLFTEQLGADLPVVVQPQELATLVSQRLEGAPRVCRGAPVGLAADPPLSRKLPSDGVLQFAVLADEPHAQNRRL